ncbi:sodium- and chloride-dependent betaine transporter [Flavobacteriaceae bacterium UJ101]|nr:sodium- and chloride-dependent betaine transporter [Flavobacteriaceae bacterium UJ101]
MNIKKNKPKAQFSNKWGFLLAAMGSAVGLGNIWRFPGQAYESGGGAFIIPYLVAILTAGIPLIILEFNLGNLLRGSAPKSYAKINRKMEALGWFQTLISFGISTYYNIILAYVGLYTIYAFSLAWGSNTTQFFLHEVVQVTDNISIQGELSTAVAAMYTGLWIVIALISITGVQKGIEKVNKIIIPLLLIMFASVVAYAISLDGAINGLNAFFTPDFSKLTDPQIWLNAYSQVFFSLSVAFAIMITYSSYTKKNTDVTSTAITTALGNSSVELLAGIGIFAALGFMSQSQGIPINEIASKGIGLTFFVIPEVLNHMPGGAIIGVLFFGSLLLAGISSLISVLEVVVAALIDKLRINRKLAVVLTASLAWLMGIAFLFGNGLSLFDIFDNAINKTALISGGILEIILILLLFRKPILKHINRTAPIRFGKGYIFCLSMTAFILISIFSYNIYEDYFHTENGYGGYGLQNNLIYGLIPMMVLVAISIGLSFIPWKKEDLEEIKTFKKEKS